MKIDYDGSIFIATATYDERMPLKDAGFRWNPDVKKWWTDQPLKAATLYDYCTDSAKAILDEVIANRDKAIEDSRAVDADIEIPVPEGLEYMPFQRAGIAYAMQRNNCLIADEMGLGKTIQAIGVINADDSIKSVLVICPASLKINWRNELTKWLVIPRSIEIMNGKTTATADILICNYDIVKKHHAMLTSQTWDLLIIDESHYLKNPKAQRTNYTLGKWDKNPEKVIKGIAAKRRIFLTGTPIVNRPIELWPILHAALPDSIGKSWTGYATRYCDGYHDGYGWNVSGASNLNELQENLRMHLMIRRLKQDVLTELPAKRRQVIELPSNGLSGVIQAEKSAWDKLEGRLDQLRANVELTKASDNPADYENAVRELREGAKAAFTEISKLRHETALAKTPLVIAHIIDSLESEDKIIVFAHHHDIINAIAAALDSEGIGYETFTGETPQNDRQCAVDRFQTDSTVKVFIGSITAAGVGITLTAASHVIFAELDWTPGNVTQAEDRAHRIGQTDNVLIQHLVLEGSLDVTMANTLVAKQAVIDRALDKETQKGMPEQIVIPMPEPETVNISRKQVEKESKTIT
ncbi:MAG: DEAD/DEAH box helicase, partial [Phycisphaerae bacterium]